MNGTAADDTTDPLIYIPAPLWRHLLEALKAANLKCDAPSPADLSASEDAVCAVTGFFESIPAVRNSGIIRPLQGLLAALPDLLRVVVRFNQLMDQLVEVNGHPEATTLEKGGTQLSMLVRLVEDVTGGQIGAVLQPARELFEAVHDRVQGGRPALFWNAPKPARNRAHHITRAHLAAAVDWLFAANVSNEAAEKWWGNSVEYTRAHKWREQAMGGIASEVTILEFERLKPSRREPVSEADAKAKALELRTIAEGRRR